MQAHPTSKMSSKERISSVLCREETDRVPLCVDSFCHGWVQFLVERCGDDWRGLKECLLDLGLEDRRIDLGDYLPFFDL